MYTPLPFVSHSTSCPSQTNSVVAAAVCFLRRMPVAPYVIVCTVSSGSSTSVIRFFASRVYVVTDPPASWTVWLPTALYA
jgi:hypothetical protein